MILHAAGVLKWADGSKYSGQVLMLHSCYIHVAFMLHSCCTHVALMLHASVYRVYAYKMESCSRIDRNFWHPSADDSEFSGGVLLCRIPLPFRGVSYCAGSLTTNPEEEDPPRSTCFFHNNLFLFWQFVLLIFFFANLSRNAILTRLGVNFVTQFARNRVDADQELALVLDHLFWINPSWAGSTRRESGKSGVPQG